MFPRCGNLLAIPRQVGVIFFRGVYKKRFYRGIYITDSMMARKDDVLVRMRNLDYVPGVNVKYSKEGYDRVLRAMCDGIVTITTEDVELDYDYFGVTRTYEWRKEVPLRKLCFNVMPKDPSRTFRLLDELFVFPNRGDTAALETLEDWKGTVKAKEIIGLIAGPAGGIDPLRNRFIVQPQ